MRLALLLALSLVWTAAVLRASPVSDALEQGRRFYAEGHLDDAERAFRLVLAAPGEAPQNTALAHKFLGNILQVRGDVAGAQREYEAALAIFDHDGNVAEVANTLSNEARLAETRRDFAAARDLYHRVLASDLAVGDNPAAGMDHQALGDIARATGAPTEAIDEYHQALILLQTPSKTTRLSESTRRDGAGLTMLALGTLAYEQGQVDAADHQYRAALDFFKRVASAAGRAKAHYQLARLNWRRGRLEQAQTSALSAMRAATETTMPVPRGDIYNVLGLISEDLGQLHNALTWYQKAVAAYGQDRQRLAATLVNIGNVHLRFGALQDAAGAFEQARASSEAVHDLAGVADARNGLGIVALRQKDAAAASLFEQAAEEAARAGDSAVQARAMANLAYARYAEGRLADAEQAAATAERLGTTRDVNARVAMLALRGSLQASQGRKPEASQSYAAAIALVEEMRGNLRHQELKATFLEDKADLYDLQIGLLTDLGRDAEVLEYLERARSRAFLDMMGDRRLRAGEGTELQALAARELALQQQAAEATGDAEQKAAAVAHKQVMKQLRKLDPEYASQRGVEPVRAAEIEQSLDEKTAMVEYYIGRKQVLAAIVTHGAVKVVRLAVTPEKLMALVAEAHEFVDDRHAILKPAWQDVLAALHAAIWAPLEPSLGGRHRVCVVPYGPLHYVSMAALVSAVDHNDAEVPSPRFLIEDYTIFYSPSASVLRFAREKNRGRFHSALVLGNAVTEMEALPASEAEARAIAGILPGARLLLGAQATETAVKVEGPHYDVIHLATHGQLNPAAPMESRILLTRTARDDGALTVAEIFRLRLHAWLVVLSACESGEVRGLSQVHEGTPAGDDLVGLTRSFLYAGTPSVVASLWPVDDIATALLMTSFYRGLSTVDKAEALRHAQLELIKMGRKNEAVKVNGQDMQTVLFKHPNEWAPFILVGDWK